MKANIILLIFISAVLTLSAKEYNGKSISFTVPDYANVKFADDPEREDYIVLFKKVSDRNASGMLTIGMLSHTGEGRLQLKDLVETCHRGVSGNAKTGTYRVDKDKVTTRRLKIGIFKGVRLDYPIILRNGENRILRYFILDDGQAHWLVFYDSASSDDSVPLSILESIKKKQ